MVVHPCFTLENSFIIDQSVLDFILGLLHLIALEASCITKVIDYPSLNLVFQEKASL